MSEPKTYLARDPIALTHNECLEILRELQAILFVTVADNDSDAIVEEWDPDKPWTANVQEALGDLMTRWQLRPRELEDGTAQYATEPAEPETSAIDDVKRAEAETDAFLRRQRRTGGA